MSASEHLGRQWFHGTARAGLTEITPAAQHGRGVTFASDTDHGHAYATTSEDHAWDYASKSHDWAMNSARPGQHFVPRVYQVEPLGEHEPDPSHDEHGRSRGNNSTDVRSPHGFRVVRELPLPRHMGTPEDWR